MHRNVQKLDPLNLEAVPRSRMSLTICSRTFHAGYRAGLTNTQEIRRFDLNGDPTEAGIVEIVRNLCELHAESELSTDILLYDCGLVTGWVLRGSVGVEA